jgi:hypothetical protein
VSERDGNRGARSPTVIAGEAELPLEHTMRVRARLGDSDPAVPAEPEPTRTRYQVAVPSHSAPPPSDERAAGTEGRGVRGYSVRAAGPGQAEVAPVEPAAEPAAASEEAPPEARADAPRSEADAASPEPTQAEPQRSSRELAEASRRQGRKERDRRAERRAMQVLVGLFAGLGGLGLLAVNLLLEDPPPSAVAVAPGAPDPAARPGVFSTAPDETPDLPVVRALLREGLTLGAEGLPAVAAVVEGPAVAAKAAVETCRFAYGVWELSPNQRFRFLTTCPPLAGQILVGAYEVEGSRVRLSPLLTEGVQLVTELELQKPSVARTQVLFQDARGAVELSVTQRLTAMRPGLDGEAFRSTYAPKNTLMLPNNPGPTGRGRPAEAAPAPERRAEPAREAERPDDPLLEMLRNPG